MIPVLPKSNRVKLVEYENKELPLSTQVQLLDVSRASLYYKPVGVSEDEIKLKHRIDEIFTAYPFYGVRKIQAQLQREGQIVNHKAVRRHMREMGLAAIYAGPNLSKRNHEHRIYPYLLRQVEAAHPNHVFGIDITYIRLKKGWMYLVHRVEVVRTIFY